MKSISKGIVTWNYQQYRSNAIKEYDNFARALAREFIQNSADAGSTKIEFITNKESNQYAVKDDGCGMTLDIIQNKLLVIGGTKKAEGSVGGLGKAKELLFFSWPEWIIETTNHTIHGFGGEYEIFEADKPRKGTIVHLTVPLDDVVEDKYGCWYDHFIREVACKCHTSAKIYLNDHEMKPYHKLGRAVKVVDGLGALHHLKSQNGVKITNSYTVDICINGCWMFDRWIGDHDGHIVLNIDSNMADPADLVSGSRDGLKYEYAQKLDRALQDIVVNKKSALIKREPTMNIIRGDGQVFVPPSDAEIDHMAQVFAKGNADETIAELEVVNGNFQLELERLQDIMKKSKKQKLDIKEIIAKYQQIVNYEPDFIIYEDRENDYWGPSRIKTFMKTQKASTIAQVWTETVKQVLWDNGVSTRFTAGFCFDKNSEAMYLKKDGKEYYFINPKFVPATGVQNKVVFVNYMRTTAVHEVTHRWYSDHNEDFVSKYHSLEANTWNSHRIYAKIGKLR